MRIINACLLTFISLLGCKSEETKPETPPSILVYEPSNIDYTSAVLTAEVINDGSLRTIEKGFYVSEKEDFSVLDGVNFIDVIAPGKYSIRFDNLKINTKYFYKARAQNSKGIFYSDIKYFTTKALPLNTVLSPTGRIWMDRNLGASRVATSSTDSEAFGDLYQWGRAADGHQLKSSNTTTALSNTDSPNVPNFITTNTEPYDWRKTGNDNLWQGVNGVNCPCPQGYRLPTTDEWQAEFKTWTGNTVAGDAFNSPLKLPLAGRRGYSNGNNSTSPGVEGIYWTSTVERKYAYTAQFRNGTGKFVQSEFRSEGASVRCIKD